MSRRAPDRRARNEARPVKHSFTIRGHRTSISLETPFWELLKSVAERDGVSLSELVAAIDAERGEASLSSAVRVWLLRDLLSRA
jgi:predicted DNA-binding ribbon-helix-helix protein